MALKLDILANTSSFVSSMKKAGASVEDIGDDLDDMAREASDAGNKMERTFRDIARESSDAGRKIGRDMKDGTDKAKKGVDDFRQEASSSMRETAASISSVEDGLDAVQEIAANAFVGFGPVGAGAGLVAALGFGLLLENLNEQNEAIAAQKQYYADAYQSAADEGRKFLDVQTILREANDIQFNPDRANEYKRALEQSKALSLDINDVLLARAGDEEALQVVMETTKQKLTEVRAASEDASFSEHSAAKEQEANLLILQKEYEKIGDLHEENAQKAANSQAIKDQLSQQERDQIKRTADADQARYEGLAEKIANLPKPPDQTVKLKVDDTEVKNYRPPVIQFKGRIQMPAGSKQLIA